MILYVCITAKSDLAAWNYINAEPSKQILLPEIIY